MTAGRCDSVVRRALLDGFLGWYVAVSASLLGIVLWLSWDRRRAAAAARAALLHVAGAALSVGAFIAASATMCVAWRLGARQVALIELLVHVASFWGAGVACNPRRDAAMLLVAWCAAPAAANGLLVWACALTAPRRVVGRDRFADAMAVAGVFAGVCAAYALVRAWRGRAADDAEAGAAPT